MNHSESGEMKVKNLITTMKYSAFTQSFTIAYTKEDLATNKFIYVILKLAEHSYSLD